MLASDEWVAGTIKAVEFAVRNGFEIVTSVGLKTYETALWAAASLQARVTIVIGENIDEGEIIGEFDLYHLPVRFLKVTGKGRRWWKLRDKAVFETADYIIPISVRKNGTMEKLLRQADPSRLIKKFSVEYNDHCSGRIPPPLSPENVRIPVQPWNYLTHWTHTTFGPRPDEKYTDFYRNIIEAGDRYPYSAYENLKNILSQEKIWATPTVRNMVRVVSFTTLDPARSAQLMKWAPSRTRYYWEPYGVSIRFEEAVKLGVRQVIYGDESAFKLLSDNEKPYFQPFGRRHQWPAEREYRHAGDFDLSKVPRDAILVLVRSEAEALEIQQNTGLKAASLQKN